MHHAELVADALEPTARLLGIAQRFGEIALPQAKVGQQGLHHCRRPVVAAIHGLGAHHAGEVFGLDETPLEEPDERQQPESPTNAIAVAEAVQRVCRRVQTFVGQRKIARQERDPGTVLFDVRQTAFVVQPEVLGLGFTEEPLGVDQRTTEQLDETTLTQRVGKQLDSIGGAQQFHTGAQLFASAGLVALQMQQHAQQTTRRTFGLDVAALHSVGQDLVDGTARLGIVAHLDEARTAQQRQPGTALYVFGLPVQQRQRAAGVAYQQALAAGVTSALGSGRQIAHCVGANAAGHTVDLTEVGDQLGRSCGVVGQVVERRRRVRSDGRGDPRMALCTRCLGQRLIRRLAHRVAAELPLLAIELEEPLRIELTQGEPIELLMHLLGKTLQRFHTAGQAKCRCVVEHLAFQCCQLIEPSSDQGAQRVGQLAGRTMVDHDTRELLQEQRVAAAAVEQRAQQRLVCGRFQHHLAQQLGRQLVAVGTRQRVHRERHDGGAIVVRRPHHFTAWTHAGDQHERNPRDRAGQVFQHVDHDLIAPVQIVDPQHQRGGLAAQLDNTTDGALHHIASSGDVQPVQRRLVAQQMQEDLGRAIDLGMARVERGTLLRAIAGHQPGCLGHGSFAHFVGRQRRIQPQVRRQRSGDGSPHVRLAVRRTHAFQHLHLTLAQLVECGE